MSFPRYSPAPRRYFPGASQCRIIFYWALILFVVIFPKSGVKAGAIPLTTGYAIICAAAFFALTDNVLHSRSSLAAFLALALCGPFGVVVALGLISNGSIDQGSALAAVTSFMVLPPIFFGLFSSQLVMIPWATIRRSIVFSLRIVAVYGVFLFFIKLMTGSFLEIPYLTVNAGDAGLLETTKNIDRGGIFKLISTYNNGNLFGASMLLLLPLYLWLERSRLFISIVIIALVLTLSRAVWLGLLVACVLTILQRRLTAQLLVALALGTGLFIFVVWLVGMWISDGWGFMIDPSLGGRSYMLEQTTNISLLPSEPVEMLPEIVYAGVIKQFGVIGLLAFVMFLLAPVAVAKMRPGRLMPAQRYAALGIYSYAFICFGDGGIMLIPVIPIFLFVSIILLEGPRLTGAKPSYAARRSASAGGRHIEPGSPAYRLPR
jgi:hypothetical protein